MAITLPVVVYGNGDMFNEIFNAIAASLNDSDYSILINMAILMSGTWAIVNYSVQRNLIVLVRWVGMYYLAFYVVFMPKVNVEIIDRINPNQFYSVSNVPLGLGIVASYTSTIGDGLTRLLEKTFTLPDDLKYQNTGMIMGSRLVAASTQFQATDPDFQQSLQSFVHQCVYYDILLGKYSWDELVNNNNLWQLVIQNASPARSFVYYQPGNSSQIMTCQAGSAQLQSQWANTINNTSNRYAALLFPGAMSPNQGQQLLTYLGESYQFLTNMSEDASSIMQQSIMANAIQEGLMHMGAETNSAAALEAYSFAKAQAQKRLTNSTVGDMAAYWLPIMKNIFEAILYASFLFVFLIILFPIGRSIGSYYVASLMWVQLWAPLYAILNLCMTIYGNYKSMPLALMGAAANNTPGLTLANQTGLAQVNADLGSLAGYLSISVPLFAIGLIKGMMSVFSQAAQYIAGVTQSAATAAAGEAISGNISLGNTNFNNHSSFNTNANHFDGNARTSVGMMTSQLPGGSTLSLTPSGEVVMNNTPAISNLGTSVNLAHALREVASEQADQAYSTGLNYANAYSHSLTSGMRSLMDLSNQLSLSQSSGDSASVSVSGGTSQALSNIHQMTSKFARDQNISYSDASKFLASAYASTKAGGGLGISAEIGMRGETDRSLSKEERAAISSAQEFINNSNFSQNVDIAVKGLQEHSFRAGNEQAQRLADSVGSSFDQASQARNDMSNSFQQAQSYREMASYADENAETINSNSNQAFMDTLSKQSAPGGGTMSMRQIESMMTTDPALAQGYAEQYVRGHMQDFMQDFHKSAGSSPQQIEQTYQNQQQAIPGETSLQKNNRENAAEVKAKARQENLDENAKISMQAVKDASTLIDSSEYGANTGSSKVNQEISKLGDSINGKKESS